MTAFFNRVSAEAKGLPMASKVSDESNRETETKRQLAATRRVFWALGVSKMHFHPPGGAYSALQASS